MSKQLIRTLNTELISVLQGRTITFETADGLEVEVRLMTADEYEAWLLDQQARDPDSFPTRMPTRQRIEELTRPLPDF
jgi:hypothetical protein